MSSHVSVYSVFVEANHDMVGDAPKLTNLEAFHNLQRKLSHLTPEEQSNVEKLLFEVQNLIILWCAQLHNLHFYDAEVESA